MSLFSNVIPSFGPTAACDANRAAGDLGPTTKPLFEANETAEAYTLAVSLPGVTKENVEITGENDQIRIVGRRAFKQPEGWTSLHRETTGATFELVLDHTNGVDVEKISAQLQDGVLQLTLPKAEALKPRKIAVG
jgi:HSP20 family protein